MVWNPNDGTSKYTTVAGVPALATNTTATAGQSASTQPSGLLSATATNATGATSTAKTRNVDNNELVTNQLNTIMGENSPLLQRAKAQTLETANGRGLLNTSMAAGAATGAMLDRATPLAQGNAATYTNVLDKNLANQQQSDVLNAQQIQQNNQFNANEANDISSQNANNAIQNNQFNANLNQNNNQFNAGQQTDVNKFNATQANNTAIVNASEQNKILAQMMDQQNKMQLADIEAQYKVLMQSEASAMTVYQQSVKNISEILMNPDLTPEAKTAAVANQNALLASGMKIIGAMGGLNLDTLLTFPTA